MKNADTGSLAGRMLKFIVVPLLLVIPIAAQDEFRLKVDAAIVSVNVGVLDSHGVPVTTLKKEDFLVYEDAQPREIRSFDSSGAPYSTLLVFDTSGSMRTFFPFLVDAVNVFFHQLGAGDRIALASFDGRVEKLTDWTLAKGIDRSVVLRPPTPVRSPGRGVSSTPMLGTDLYGALEWAAGEVGSIAGRRGVIVFTDGQDTRDAGSEKDAFGKALRVVAGSGVPFYFIGIGTDHNSFGQPTDTPGMKRGRVRMEEVAKRSGGLLYLPKKIEDVVPLYGAIARELGTSYTLGFSPANPDDAGSYHRIEVRVRDTKLRVTQSRQGYTGLAK